VNKTYWTPSKLRSCGAHTYISFRLWVRLWISLPYSVLPRSLGRGCLQSVDFRQPLLLIPLLYIKTWRFPNALPRDLEIVLYSRHLRFPLFSSVPHFFGFYSEILCACFSLKLLWPLFFFVQWLFFFERCIRRTVGCSSSQVAPFHTG